MEKVHFTEEKATNLATLYGRALDYRSAHPILGDKAADDAVRRIDYDFTKIGISPDRAVSVVLRAKPIDDWAAEYLRAHPDAIVLHLGCGLDSRYYRLDPPPSVEWYDVDYPDVAELRRQLFPAREHCHVVAASVTDPAWLSDVSADRPTLMIGEGLTMYLTEADGVALLRRIVDHAPSGELQFDAFSRFGIRTQWSNAVVRRSGATLHWGIDGPDEILRAVPGLRLLAWVSPFDSPTFADVSLPFRVMAKVMSVSSKLRYMAQYHRYSF